MARRTFATRKNICFYNISVDLPLFSILPQLVAYNCPQDWWKAFIGALQAKELTDGGAVLVGWVDPVLISASLV